MPTVAAYVEIPQSQLRRVAEQVLRWIENGDRKRTATDFVNRYNKLKSRMFPGEVVPHMHRWRVGQFKNLARGSPSRNVRVPYCREIRVIAAVIGMPVEALLGIEDPTGRSRLDVMEGPQHAATLVGLMGKFQPETQELIAWAEFVPCSLETPAFMHAHHEALFVNPGDVMTWDGIGNTRRSELLAAGSRRAWTMTQINFLSDLRRIADGEKEYDAVQPILRKECLLNLAGLIIKNPELKIRLLVIDDINSEKAMPIKSDLAEYDSVITWDRHLMIVRDRLLGVNYYSEKPRHTGYWRGMMEELMSLATYKNPTDVHDLLRALAARVPEDAAENPASNRVMRVS